MTPWSDQTWFFLPEESRYSGYGSRAHDDGSIWMPPTIARRVLTEPAKGTRSRGKRSPVDGQPTLPRVRRMSSESLGVFSSTFSRGTPLAPALSSDGSGP